MDVEIVESKAVNPDQLEAWWRLFHSAPDTRFYHHPHWLQCISEHLLASELHLGFLSLDGQLQMVLPLCGSAGERRRVHPRHDHISLNDGTGWWDWKIPNLAHHSVLTQALANNHVSTDLGTATSSAKTRLAKTERNNKSAQWVLKKTRQSASFNCSGDERAPSGKLRRNLRRLRKQLDEHGKLRVDIVVKSDELSNAWHLAGKELATRRQPLQPTLICKRFIRHC